MKYMNKLRYWLINKLGDNTQLTVSANEQAKLISELAFLRREMANITAATKYELVQKELGSYIPDLTPFEKQSDDFKNSIGRLCMEINNSKEMQYLFTHLKQDQVNASLFQERKSEDWVLGSINGVYITSDMIQLLGNNYEERLKKGLIKD